MKYVDLRGFLDALEADRELIRIQQPVSPRLEMTAISDAVLRDGGPALQFSSPVGFDFPVLTNLFGTSGRVARAMGADDVGQLRDIGTVLANLKEPEPPKGLADAGRLLQMARSV